MTEPCYKEAEIATLKENMRWQNRTLADISRDQKTVLGRLTKLEVKVYSITGVIAIVVSILSGHFHS